MTGRLSFMEEELERRRCAARLRSLRRFTPLDGAYVEVDGKKVLNVCSNDYLGLSRHTMLVERAALFMERYGAGSTASRLVCGNYECFEMIEQKLARLKKTQAALLLPTGYQANATILPALCDKNSLILSDRLNHNSIISGCALAKCAVAVFEHNDTDHLEKLLAENRNKGFSRIVIVTESVFSMEGDTCDIDALCGLSKKYGALLMVDEAHATGVFGENGMGLSCGRDVDIVMGTFGKGAGSFGAYVACSSLVREYLINRCSGFIYSTGLPPAVLGAIDAALDLIPQMDKERRSLLENADRFRKTLASAGLDTGGSSTQIVPVVVGSEEAALDLSKWLEERGFLAVAIRPPSVPEESSRVRVSLCALHTDQDTDRLASQIIAWSKARDHKR